MKFGTLFRSIILLALFLVSTKISHAQTTKVEVNKLVLSGFLKESLRNNNISNASVVVRYTDIDSVITSVRTNKDGVFRLLIPKTTSKMQLRITHIGFKDLKKDLNVHSNAAVLNLGTIFLQKDTLKTIRILNPNDSMSSVLGSIKGKVKDSIYKNLLTSATISVYNHADSNLLQFTLPNNFGEFTIGKLPVNTPLKLMVTHLGYTPYKKIFKLSAAKNVVDFDWIYMNQNEGKENTLKEVEITSYAPVRMNGDTIEFNPRAFNMDVNATAEDLMRRLPGMVIWGDGDITYNGKKINSLLVDGKPFMGGGDFTTATQNLPKEVLDKVQIYSQRDERNPLDSTLNANLKLKDDRKMGYFGKIGGGYGSEGRIAGDGMLSGYNKKAQIINVVAYNNVNKSANNIAALIRSNSFKGEGNSMDYQSDFTRHGINVGTTAGTKFQYDFIPDVSWNKSKRFIGEYFFKQNEESINSNRVTNTLLNADSMLNNSVTNKTDNSNTNHNLSTNYYQRSNNYNLSISADVDMNSVSGKSKSESEQGSTGVVGNLSSNTAEVNSQNTQNRINFNAVFNYLKDFRGRNETRQKREDLFSDFTLNYRFEYTQNNGNRNNLSTFLSNVNPNSNISYDRLYEYSNSSTNNTIGFGYPKLKTMLFGYADFAGIELDLGGKLIFSTNDFNSFVSDKNTASQLYETNNYLTNNRDEHIKDIQPRLTISKNFYRVLTNRFDRTLSIFLTSAMQFYSMKSIATNQSQNINYQYSNFIPRGTIGYKNHQYGEFEVNSNMNYTSIVNYPSVNSIAPLVDSTNVWYIPKGNRNLRPEHLQTFSWKTTLESRKPKNPYSIDLNVDGTYSWDKISDSTFYDNSGRRINYNVNLGRYKYWHLGSSYRKSYSPNKKNTYRVNISYNHYNYTVPQYLNAIRNTSNNRNNDFDIELAYSFLELITINAKQGFSYYKNVQENDRQEYKGVNNYTRFSGTLQFPKNFTWSTNINFNINKAENQTTVNYTIWNSSLTYRFMEGNRGEIKFSALDLLKQNKGVINNTNRNVQTFGFNNVLQQYFMLSLAYYPRKFGK